MGIRRTLKRLVERVTNRHLLRTLPRGVDIFSDTVQDLPFYRAQVVFDVGANIGQSARKFKEGFSTSTIYCFEPVAATFEQLRNNIGRTSTIRCFQLAVGRSTGTGRMVLRDSSSHLMTYPMRECYSATAMTEEVTITTIDSFCQEHFIPQIDYLKIDTEGHDLAVLEGANDMLHRQTIGLVEAEVGMNHRNQVHVPLHELQVYLEERRYFLFGIYEQVPEFLASEPHLRRSNSVFISQKLIDENRVVKQS